MVISRRCAIYSLLIARTFCYFVGAFLRHYASRLLCLVLRLVSVPRYYSAYTCGRDYTCNTYIQHYTRNYTLAGATSLVKPTTFQTRYAACAPRT